MTERDGAAVTSVDALVEGVHFEAPPFELRQVGAKALAVALSDLAAMGAAPAEAYVQLGVPEGRRESELLELADGLVAVAAEHGVAIAGGDVTRAPVLLLAVTVVGSAASAADARHAGRRPARRPGRGHRGARRRRGGPAVAPAPGAGPGHRAGDGVRATGAPARAGAAARGRAGARGSRGDAP